MMGQQDIDPVQYGILLQKVQTMEKEVGELRGDVQKLLELANKSRGGFWAGMAMVSVLSGLGGYISAIVNHPK